MFGSHVVAVDAKGRVSVPARFREYLGATFGGQVVLLGMDGCIFAYPLAEWKRRFSEKIRSLPTSRREVRRYLRRMYGRAVPCELDRQGRILLPARLRAAVGIEKEAVIVGIEDRFEIWGRARWDEETDEQTDAAAGALNGEGDALEEGSIDLEF